MSNKKSDSSNNKTFKYKHVKVNKSRPHLTKGKTYEKIRKKTFHKKNPNINSSIQKNKDAHLRIIPLGGLDGIGKNMTIFECGSSMIIVDAGIMFPDDSHPGVDLILPDYTYVLENSHKLKAIFITHGHEDHTGALPYLLKDLEIDIPIYATKLSIGLLRSKFNEFNLKNIKLCEIKSSDSIQIGCYKANFFSVNHSIPGSIGIFLQTPAGNILHTGDFKLDQTPIDGITTDYSLISKFAKTGIDVLMSDSTNAMINKFTQSESVVGPTLEDIIDRANGKVIIASFASHIHRIQQVCDAAIKCGRKVVVTGRSMVQNTEIARNLGYLNVADENIIDAYELKSIPNEKAVVLCTGSQGEPLSALARMAQGSHKTIHIDEGDTVIISATPVPGNEKAVSNVINDLSKIGVDIYDKNRSKVHVSGHAGSEELKIMITMTNPYAFIPIHGEAQQLLAHAKLADDVGVNPENIFVCDNGDVIELTTNSIRRKKPVMSGVVFVDGLSVGDTSENVLHDRNILAGGGICMLNAAISKKHNKIQGKTEIIMKGVSGGDDSNLVNELNKYAYDTIKKELVRKNDLYHIKKSSKRCLLNLIKQKTRTYPMVVVNIIEL